VGSGRVKGKVGDVGVCSVLSSSQLFATLISSPVTGIPDSFATLLCIRFLSLGLEKTPSEGEG